MRPAKRATRGEGEGGIPQGGDGEWKALPRGRWTKTPNRAREPTFPSNLEGEWLLLKSVATAVSQILLVLFASQPCYSSWKVNPPEVAASPSFRLPSWQPCPASPLLFAGEEDDERRRRLAVAHRRRKAVCCSVDKWERERRAEADWSGHRTHGGIPLVHLGRGGGGGGGRGGDTHTHTHQKKQRRRRRGSAGFRSLRCLRSRNVVVQAAHTTVLLDLTT